MVRAGTISGNGTINANGAAAPGQPGNDAGGGGGAGGSVLVLAENGYLPAGLNINATGGRGGDAWPTQAPGAVYPGNRHGPGGGGGGGTVYLSSNAGTVSVAAGQNGVTTTVNDFMVHNPAVRVYSLPRWQVLRSRAVSLERPAFLTRTWLKPRAHPSSPRQPLGPRVHIPSLSPFRLHQERQLVLQSQIIFRAGLPTPQHQRLPSAIRVVPAEHQPRIL